MSGKDPKSVFEKVIVLLQQGANAEAESLCRAQLLDDPRDVNFLSVLGSILLRKNDFEGCEEILRTVVSIAPEYPNVQEDLGTVLLNLGKPAEALPHLQEAIKTKPSSAGTFFKLGGALKSLGRDEAGDAALAHAAKLSPNQANLEKATKLFAEGKFRESEIAAKKVIADKPKDVNAGLLLARIAIHARAYKEAEKLLRKVVEYAPRFILAWHELGVCLREQHKDQEAAEAMEQCLEMDPENSTTFYHYGAALAMAGRTDEAARAYQRAIDIEPQQVGAHVALGHVLKTLGDQEGGIAAYRSAIALKPNLGETYFSLSNLKTFRFQPSEIESMLQRIEQPSLPSASVVHFAFSLGKAFEDNADYDKAFQYYALGNAENRQSITYDPVQTEVAHAKMRETYSAEFFDRANAAQTGVKDSDPIFIVGLPRSGSTLLEQILASHSLVEGTSELPDLGIVSQMISNKQKGRIFPSGILEMSDSEITELGQKYMDRTRRHRSGTPYFTDKMPNNFAHIGLIHAILPNAKIIDARRHPLDSCVGCFKQHFAKGQTFTYDMFELGEFYLEYDKLMSHWDELLPGKVLRVQYENVVSDLENQVKRILSHCNLPFERACVDFHQTKRAVRTASSEQVRQPIYQGSINTWKKFDSHIEPLKEILRPLLDENDPSIITGK